MSTIKKGGSPEGAAFFRTSAPKHRHQNYFSKCLDSLNVLGLKTFLALSHIEANRLAFGQGFET